MTPSELITGEIPVVVSFEAFYQRHRTRLCRALDLTIRNPDVAHEAVDEAMARAAQRWDTVGGYDAPEGWVYRVALNWARSVFRRRRAFVVSSEAVWDDLPDPDLARAVEGLPMKLRSVIVARYYLDWSVADVARALSLPEGTVKSRIHRALGRLERDLGGTR